MSISNELNHGLIELRRNGTVVHKVRFFVHNDATITAFDDRLLSLGLFKDWGSFMIYLNEQFQADIRIVAVND